MKIQFKYFVLFILSTLVYSFISLSTFAQSPQAIPYQAVARDVSGNILSNQQISIRMTLIDSTINMVDYQEIHQVITNSLGLFNLNIGQGTPVVGTLSGIYWPISGNEYLQVEMDPSGGTSYINMGTSRLNSVPFALHANTSSDNHWNENGTSVYNNNNGSVGIGTSSPSAKLDVNGMAFFRNNNGGLLSPSVGAGIKITTENNQGNIFGFNYSNFTPIDLVLQGSGGKVGIGTSYPETSLHVNNQGNPTKITIGGGDANYGTTNLVLGTSAFNNGQSEIQSIGEAGISWGDLLLNKNGGNVGIGVIYPDAPLNVRGTIHLSANNSQGGDGVVFDEAPYAGNGHWVMDAYAAGFPVANKLRTYNDRTGITVHTIMDNGNVGIGDFQYYESALAKLDVKGNVKISDGTEGAGKVLTSDASGFASWQSTPTFTETDPKIGFINLHFTPRWNGTVLTDGQIFDDGVNVGINTSSPSRKLEVIGDISLGDWFSGNASSSRRFGVMDATTHVAGMEIENTALGGNYSQKLHLLTHHYAGSYGRRFTIDEDGSVGIGIENPLSLLHVNGTGQFGNYLKIGTDVSEGYFQNTQDGAYRALQSGGDQGYFFQNYNGITTTMYVGLNGTYQGKVGIGTASPQSNLDVNGSTKTNTIQITNGASNGAVLTADSNGNATWRNIGCVIRAQNWTATANGTNYSIGSYFAPTIITSTGIYGDTRLINSGAMNTITGNATNTAVFTAPVEGYYQLSVKAISVASSVRFILLGSLNGAVPVEIYDVLTSNPCANCSDISHTQIIYLNAGDTHRVLRSASGASITDMMISYRKL